MKIVKNEKHHFVVLDEDNFNAVMGEFLTLADAEESVKRLNTPRPTPEYSGNTNIWAWRDNNRGG